MRRDAADKPASRLTTTRHGLIFVALAAALVSMEGLLRRPLLDHMPVTSIVLAEQQLLACIAIPVAIAHRRMLARLTLRTWGVLLLIGVGASGGAALLFTKALDAGNPTTASLLQSSQPLFVVFLARIVLGERLTRLYWPCLAVSICGASLLSFGAHDSVVAFSRGDVVAAGCALGAAALWAGGTVLGRLVLADLSYVTLTALRILIALPFLWIVALGSGDAGAAFSGLSASPLRIAAVALGPGLVAVLLFYRGLQSTKASHAVLAECMYPATALVGNWLVLGTLITPLQGVGCLLLITTVLALAWSPERPPRRRQTPTWEHPLPWDISYSNTPLPTVGRGGRG